MLKKLRIKNFKIWEDTGEIELAPITLFFGANSSGKSSIGQFLMLLKQTVESNSREVFYSGNRNSAVQLGSYEEMVFQRDTEKMIKFEYQWSPNATLKFTDPAPPHKPFFGNTLAFQAEVGARDQEGYLIPYVDLFKYKLIKDGERQLSLGLKLRKGTESDYQIESPDFVPNNLPPGRKQEITPVRFSHFPNEIRRAYTNIPAFVSEFHYQHEELFNALFYLGPLRAKPEGRHYYYGGGKLESVGYEGEDTILAILEARHRKIKLSEEPDASLFEEVIAFMLMEMELIEDFKDFSIEEISSSRMYEVKIRTKGSKIWVDIPDVGFGISQVLPVLVQCFYAPEGSIILIDQPEVHLHPYAQSALADVMIDAIKSQVDSGNGLRDRNIQLIIETHSEHFLRRLQRRIAEGKLDEKDVRAYFAKQQEKELKELDAEDIRAYFAKLERLQIDEYGNIRNWPENFFGDEMGDILAQAEAAMQKPPPVPLEAVPGVGKKSKMRDRLEAAGILSANDLVRVPLTTLLAVPKVGEATAEKLRTSAREIVDASVAEYREEQA